MNCYDFDKTIYAKDSAIQFLLFAIKRNLSAFFYSIKICFFALLYFCKIIKIEKFKEVFYGVLKFFKNKDQLIKDFWDKEEKHINKWYLNQMKDNDVICSASPLFLVEPIMKKINPNCKVFATNFNIETMKIEGKNLKAGNKQQLLKDAGYVEFDSVYTDSLSDFPLYDMARNKYLVVGEKVYEFKKQKIPFFKKIKYIIKELRVKHYIKNGLLFLPLIFSGLLFKNNFKYFFDCIFGFVAFSCIASIVYLINDFIDVEKDRLHPKKRKRPYAAYMLSKLDMFVLFFVLIAISLLIWYFRLDSNIFTLAILLGYLTLNLLYSFVLKNLAIIDIFALAACYVIRVYFGAVIINVGVSKWLYLTIICASLYLGLGKRRGELTQVKESETRKVNKKYTYEFLDKNMNMCLTMCTIFYSLWVVEYRVFSLSYINSILFLSSIPIVIFILMKYSLNVEKNQSSGDPIEVFLSDFVLLAVVAIFVVVLVLAIYIPMPEIVVGNL